MKNSERTDMTEINLSNVNKGPANDDATTEKTNEPTKTKITIKSILNFFTVEPFLLCYLLPSVISAIAVQKLNLEKACLADLNYTELTCHKIITGDIDDNENDTAASVQAQELVAAMTAWKQPIQSGIPAIVILFVGAWSDKTGNRKALLLIPILGEIISSIGMLLTTYYFLEWPLWVTGLIEAIPPAFTGGWSIALMGSYSFIADVTTLDSRTFRIGVVAVIVTLGIPLGSSISGVLTEYIGYYGIFSIGLVLYVIGFIHTYFRIHDIRRTETEQKFKLIGFFHPKNVVDTLSLLVKSKDGKKRLIQIWLVICAHIIIVGPVFGIYILLITI